MKITKRQLRRIIREAIGDQLPYRHGQPWQDPDMPVGRGAEVYDDPLDRELTDEEMDGAGYFEEESWPLRFGYTDKTGETVEFIANNNADADEFFSMFFKEYGRDYPYSVN
jgi:hypothetical protein